MANLTPAFAAASLAANDVPTVYSSGNENASGSAITVGYFDFGSGTLEDGYTSVTVSDVYDEAKGYGFTSVDNYITVILKLQEFFANRSIFAIYFSFCAISSNIMTMLKIQKLRNKHFGRCYI